MAKKNDYPKQSVGQPENIGFSLTRQQMEDYCRRIIDFLEREKSYCRSDYSIWELKRDLGISVKTISSSINGYMGRNFSQLLNRMRVEESKRIMRSLSESGEKMKMDEIGYRSGFNSRSVFLARFSEYEGITPRKYMNLYILTIKKY